MKHERLKQVSLINGSYLLLKYITHIILIDKFLSNFQNPQAFGTRASS